MYTRREREELKALGERMHAWFSSLSLEEKVEHLKRTGILDSEGLLSSSYGGDGAPTRGIKNVEKDSA